MTFSKVIANLRGSDMPEFDVVEVQPINALAARLVLQASEIEGFTQEQWRDAVASKFDGQVKLVKSSLSQFPSTMKSAYNLACHVTATTKSKAYTQEAAEGMILVKANLFKDEADNLWRVVEMGGHKRLIQTANDNLDEILAARLSRRQGVYRLEASAKNPSINLNGVDYISYFNTSTNTVRCGQAIVASDKLQVLDRLSGQLIEIMPTQIVASRYNEKIEADLTPSDKHEHLEYMRILFGNEPEYFSSLEQLLLGA